MKLFQTNIKNERLEQLKEVASMARLCLVDENFSEYRKRYLAIRDILINDMLECSEPDPIKYALEMSTLTTKIKTLGLLLGSIEGDAKFEEPTVSASNAGEQPASLETRRK